MRAGTNVGYLRQHSCFLGVVRSCHSDVDSPSLVVGGDIQWVICGIVANCYIADVEHAVVDGSWRCSSSLFVPIVILSDIR